tara:strand:+ start:37 stop:237 length:201 start_codon:yes stop_codon:yes gene_type:complete
MEVEMKKQYKLSIKYDDALDEVDSLSEELSVDGDDGAVWLDTGDGVIKLPSELLPYLRETDILGIA